MAVPNMSRKEPEFSGTIKVFSPRTGGFKLEEDQSDQWLNMNDTAFKYNQDLKKGDFVRFSMQGGKVSFLRKERSTAPRIAPEPQNEEEYVEDEPVEDSPRKIPGVEVGLAAHIAGAEVQRKLKVLQERTPELNVTEFEWAELQVSHMNAFLEVLEQKGLR